MYVPWQGVQDSQRSPLVNFRPFHEGLCGPGEGFQKDLGLFVMSESFAEHRYYSLAPQVTPKTR
ncbi:MAG: hypothetical protein NTZ17_12115, partial [Phycisphaerae bacterium]|nr:hypothetical protein [Phycisphaerae bacterium]